MLLIYEGVVVGYIFVTEHDETVGFLPIMAVSEAHRGKKLGKILFINCIINFKNTLNHMTTIGLSVTEKNEPAFSMYKNYGFKLHENNSTYILNKSEIRLNQENE